MYRFTGLEQDYTSKVQESIFSMMVKAGADTSLLGKSERTILHTAIACRREISLIIHIMTNCTFDIDATDEDGFTALHLLMSGNIIGQTD